MNAHADRPLAHVIVPILILACTLAFALGLGAPSTAHATSDVQTVHADSLVYRGGTYDFEVEPVGYTAKSYTWRLHYGSSSWSYDKALKTIYGDDDPDWFSGITTNHLRFNTSSFENDSQSDDWGAMEFYCVITDTNGKEHKSDRFHMNIKGTDTFNYQYAKQEEAGKGLAFKSVSPAVDASGFAVIEMKTGESKTFSFESNQLADGWLSESEPTVSNHIGAVSLDLTLNDYIEGTSYTLTPTQAGEYMVMMHTGLWLGNGYDSGKGKAIFYQVIVTDPVAPTPSKQKVASIAGKSKFTIEDPWTYGTSPEAGETIPAVSAEFDTTEPVTGSIGWYKETSAGWQSCAALGEKTFEGGKSYRLQATLTAGDGYYMGTNPHGVITSLTMNAEIEGYTMSGKSLKPNKVNAFPVTYIPKPAYPQGDAVYVLREYDVAMAGATNPDVPPSSPSSGSGGWSGSGGSSSGIGGGDSTYQYEKTDGTLATSEFIKIDDAWYYFDANSNMVTGWQQVEGALYYFGDNGKLVSTIDGITDLSAAEVDDIPDCVYNGKKQKPAPEVALYGRTLTAGVDYELSYKKNKKVGTATVTVTGTGSFDGTVKKQFDIVPEGTEITELKKGSKCFTATWTEQATQTSGYELQYSRKKSFADPETVTINDPAKVSKKVKNLEGKKTYYVRIRTFKTVDGADYYSTWSATKKVKTKA